MSYLCRMGRGSWLVRVSNGDWRRFLAADVAGYSRLMGADEVETLEALKAIRRDIVDPAIAVHRGRIVKTTGDGMLVEFASAVDAVGKGNVHSGTDGHSRQRVC